MHAGSMTWFSMACETCVCEGAHWKCPPESCSDLLTRVTFEPGGTQVPASASEVLDGLVDILEKWPVRLEVRGLPGDRASASLSRARAAAVVAALVQRGVPRSRIELGKPARSEVAAGSVTFRLHVEFPRDRAAR